MKEYEDVFQTRRKPFIVSEIGVVQVTQDMTDKISTLKTTVTDAFGCQKDIIKAGTIYPSNDGSAKGIVYENVEEKEGHYIGSLMINGTVYSNRLTATPTSDAKTALEKIGIKFQVAPDTVRPDFGVKELVKLAAPTIAYATNKVTVTPNTSKGTPVSYVLKVNDVIKATVAHGDSVEFSVTGYATGDEFKVYAVGDYKTTCNSDDSAVAKKTA